MIHDLCDCPKSQKPGASITTTMPDGWQQMEKSVAEFYAQVTCTHCGKVLKPAATVRWWDKPGGPGWRTAAP